jgi:hypothetical protein
MDLPEIASDGFAPDTFRTLFPKYKPLSTRRQNGIAASDFWKSKKTL